MVTLQPGNPFGESIQAAEIDDGSITAAKLGTGWVKVASGSSTGALVAVDETVTARHLFKLVFWCKNTTAFDDTLYLRFNGDAAAHYDAYDWASGTYTAQIGINYGPIIIMGGNTWTNGDITFNGKGNVHTASNQIIADMNDPNYRIGIAFIHKGAADVTRLQIISGQAYDFKWALYYNKDVEDAA